MLKAADKNLSKKLGRGFRFKLHHWQTCPSILHPQSLTPLSHFAPNLCLLGHCHSLLTWPPPPALPVATSPAECITGSKAPQTLNLAPMTRFSLLFLFFPQPPIFPATCLSQVNYCSSLPHCALSHPCACSISTRPDLAHPSARGCLLHQVSSTPFS